MAARKAYPEWVEKYRENNTSIKLIRGKYYLYRRTGSKRVKGKKYPQPIDEYVGVITEEDGLIPAKKNRVCLKGIEVREYGFSKALTERCPDSWKQLHGKDWEELLRTVIVSRSSNSYLLDEYDIKDWNGFRGYQRGAVTASLGRKLHESYGVSLEDLQMLGTIYIVRMEGKAVLSNIHDNQRELLERLSLVLEVH